MNSEIKYDFWDFVDKFHILNTLRGVEQNPQYHAEGDVFKHTEHLCNELLSFKEFSELNSKEKNILFFAATFHDIGKVKCTKLEDGNIVTPNHGAIGAKMFREYFYKEFPVDFHFREKVASLIKYHGRPLFFAERNNIERQIIETSLNTNLKLLYILAKADLYGRVCDNIKDLESNLEIFKEIAMEQNCFLESFKFKNELTKQKYLNGNNIWQGDELYDKNTFKVIMLSGIPYSGKDSYVKSQFNGCNIISLDEIRKEHKISPKDGSAKVVGIGKEKAKEYLRKRETFIWNATNIKREIRTSLIDLFSSYGAITELHYIETPYNNILKRMEERDRVVPKDIVDKMIGNMDIVENSEGIIKYLIK